MDAIEFSGKIEKGLIRLPKRYEGYDNSQVRVIVLIEEPKRSLDRKERLRLALRKMEKIKMFSKIEDPIVWQKEMRNEWE
ncbi:MAG: hypothetical protein IPL27_26315 [Lewinellaceae bacterium]|nr:hypothetical protein [Lewinellaceae bacterium]